MNVLLKLALMLLSLVPFVVAQTAEHKPAPVDPALTAAPSAPFVQPQTAIQQKSSAITQKSVRIEENSAPVPAQVRLVAFQADRHDENDTPMYSAGNSLGNELGSAVSRSLQMHKFHSYVKKTCQRYGAGTSWVWMFSNGQTVEGTCN